MNAQKRRIVKKRKKKRKILRRILLLFILFLIGIAIYFVYLGISAYNAANNSYEELINRDGKSKLREKAVNIKKDPFSILFIGVENYSSGKKSYGRSDTLMLATFDPKNSTMKLLSIPRDTKVYIEDLGKRDKINHAFAKGGKESTIDTIENFLDIPIDYYATINFDGFVDIVDILGGVTVNVPFDFWDYKNGDSSTKFYFKKGKMTLNGEEALTYVRMRKKDPRGDFGRNERQREVLKALIDEALKPSSLLKIDKITKEIGNNVETNFKIDYLLALREKYADFKTSNIETLTFEGQDDYTNGTYYFLPDEDSIDKIKSILKIHLGLSQDNGYYNNDDENTDQT
jgi:LCP family protein required for cell wall assembly